MQSTIEVKATAHQLIDTLPDDTTWEKLLYTLQIRHDIEAGLSDSKSGRVMSREELCHQLRK